MLSYSESRPTIPQPSEDEMLQIYNIYLQELGVANSRPYRRSSSLAKLDEKKRQSLLRLTKFFKNQSHIPPSDFFKASFNRTHEKFLQISYFLTPKATGNYKMWNLLHSRDKSEF